MKLSVITSFFTYASITSFIRLPPPTFPRLKRLQVVSYYKDTVLRKLRGQKLYKERQPRPLGFGKPPEPAYSFKSKKGACAAAVSLGQTQTHSLPPKTLADNYQQFNDLLEEALLHVNMKRKLKNELSTLDVTAYELVDFLNNTTNPTFKAIRANYKDFELCMLTVDWLDIMDSPRCLSKQLSRYASTNSPEHKDSLDAIGLTKDNCHLWLPVLLRQRCSAKIHSYRQDNIHLYVRYDLAIPLENPSSQAYNDGEAGSNLNNPNLPFIPYTLILKYRRDPNQNVYLKIGEVITGFVRKTKYNKRDMDCINFLIPQAIPLSGCASNVTQLQQILKSNPFRRGTYSTLKVLKLIAPISGRQKRILKQLKTSPLTQSNLEVLERNPKYRKMTERLFGKIARTITIENNKNVQTDYP